jgi:EpsI family protein
MSRLRLAVAASLLGAAGLLARGTAGDSGAADFPAARVPMAIGTWQGSDGPPIDPETRRVLGADGVVNRTYAGHGSALDLYIAYYAHPRPGVSVHSPLNCLPGSGWEVRATAVRELPPRGAGAPASARRLIIAKPDAQAVVLYWYAVEGRMLASEVGLRWSLFRERLRGGSAGAALVRIVVPLAPAANAESSADQTALAFAEQLMPYLPHVGS